MLCLSGVILAAERDAATALEIAANLVREQVNTGIRRAPAHWATPTIVARGASYYAVNTGSGFVLVGADDRLQEVLGYSDEGDFDTTNENLQYWLSCYDAELETMADDVAPARVQPFKDELAPIVTSRWNQSAPYNNLCPIYSGTSRSASGCVATAMAQIMYFHKYPVTGTGSHSYLWVNTADASASQTLSANFGATTYDWDNMIDSYRGSYNQQQAAAVATLMYHCGVSVDMGYGSSSGAYTNQVPAALKNYFGYDPNYQRIRKELYPIDSLNQIIRAELKANRPVLVSGSNDEGGHAFVCDGYNKNAYFHINWGWGGSSDGYFLLTALNPGQQGIGGTTKGYNKGTELYVGLQPKTDSSTRLPVQMGADSISTDKLTYSRSQSITGSIYRLQNFGLDNFSGYYGFALYKEDTDEQVALLKQSSSYSLSAGYYRTTVANLSFTIPNSVPDGPYQLCAVYKENGGKWHRMMTRYDEFYKTVYISGSTISFVDNHEPAALTLTSAIEIPKADSVPYTGVPVSFSVKNTGGTFRGDISARIYQGNFSKGQYEIQEDVTIRRGETYNSALQQQFDEKLVMGKLYKMKLCWRMGESDSWHEFTPTEYNVQQFTLYDPFPHLELTEPIHFENNDYVQKSGGELFYSIKNTGGTFVGELMVAFRQDNFARGTWEPVSITIGTGETLTGSIISGFEHPAGSYTAHLRCRSLDQDEWTLLANDSLNAIVPFTLIDDVTPTDVLSIEEDACWDVYDIMGQVVLRDALPASLQSIPAGIYILRDKQNARSQVMYKR